SCWPLPGWEMGCGMPSTSTRAESGLRGHTDPQPLLQVNDLDVGFTLPHGITQVVHSLNLAVPHQGALAVVGESGSGKSVAMRSLLGLLPGTARVSGSAVLTTGRGQGRDLLAM